jgi:hypothetical protein
MHSLKQGNFFSTKKNGYQYLERKPTSKLIEGFQEGLGPDSVANNWILMENQVLNHAGTALTDNDKHTINGFNTVPGYNSTFDATQKDDKDIELMTKISEKNDDIYAFEILSNDSVLYYKKQNGNFPNSNTIPTVQPSSGARLFLKKNNGMIQAQITNIGNDNAIEEEIKVVKKKFHILSTWYDKILDVHSAKLKEFYILNKQKHESGGNTSYKNKIIKWNDGNDKYFYVNSLGVYRPLKMDGGAIINAESGSVGNSEKRGLSHCPISVTDIGTEFPSNLTSEGTTYTNWEGACFNPGIYAEKSSTSSAKRFMDERGDFYSIDNDSADSKCNEFTHVPISSFNNLPSLKNNPTKRKCNFEDVTANADTQKMSDLTNELTALNNDLKNLASITGGDYIISDIGKTIIKDLYPEVYVDRKIDKGLREIAGDLPGGGDDAGYRKLQHAIMNEETIHLPFLDNNKNLRPHFTNDVHDTGENDSDISGILVTQHALNERIKELSNLGNNVASLDSSMITKQEQIRAVNLQFLAWGLAGITIGAISIHSFFKK